MKDIKPTFSIRIEDERYIHPGLFPHDTVLCDNDCTVSNGLMVGVWDDRAHLCTLVSGTLLFDEETKGPVPGKVILYGRALYFVRNLVPIDARPAVGERRLKSKAAPPTSQANASENSKAFAIFGEKICPLW